MMSSPEQIQVSRRLADTSTGLDEKLARLRVHRNNIHRYRRLLGTTLTELERDYVERRLAEERSAMDVLAAETFPLKLPEARPLSLSVA